MTNGSVRYFCLRLATEILVLVLALVLAPQVLWYFDTLGVLMTWNSLSADLRDPTCSDESFRRSLKTFLFAKY